MPCVLALNYLCAQVAALDASFYCSFHFVEMCTSHLVLFHNFHIFFTFSGGYVRFQHRNTFSGVMDLRYTCREGPIGTVNTQTGILGRVCSTAEAFPCLQKREAERFSGVVVVF